MPLVPGFHTFYLCITNGLVSAIKVWNKIFKLVEQDSSEKMLKSSVENSDSMNVPKFTIKIDSFRNSKQVFLRNYSFNYFHQGLNSQRFRRSWTSFVKSHWFWYLHWNVPRYFHQWAKRNLFVWGGLLFSKQLEICVLHQNWVVDQPKLAKVKLM